MFHATGRYSAFVGGAYSKSLHYKERLLAQQTMAEPVKQAGGVRHRSSSIPQADSSDSVPSAILSTIIDIIELNNALKLPSAAYGCMKAVGNFPRVSSALSQKIARTATSSLTQWDQVLLRYRQQTASLDPFANTRGYQVISYARCLDKMFQWSQLADIVSESWSSLQTPDRQCVHAVWQREPDRSLTPQFCCAGTRRCWLRWPVRRPFTRGIGRHSRSTLATSLRRISSECLCSFPLSSRLVLTQIDPLGTCIAQ